MLRDSLATSEKVAAMAPGSQDRLPRYFLIADDYGCFLLQPQVIKGRIYALRDDISPEIVAGDLAEFERVGCLMTWTSNGKTFAWFTGWWEHNRKPRKGSTRKTPRPPHPLADPPEVDTAVKSAIYENSDQPSEQVPLPIRAHPQRAAADPRTPAPAVRSTQSQYAVAGKEQTPIAPASGGSPPSPVRLVQDPGAPPPVKLRKRKRPGTSLAQEREYERQEQRDLRSRALDAWIRQRMAPAWDDQLAREVPGPEPNANEQLAWVQEKFGCTPEEATDVVAIVESIRKPQHGARNGHVRDSTIPTA